MDGGSEGVEIAALQGLRKFHGAIWYVSPSTGWQTRSNGSRSTPANEGFLFTAIRTIGIGV
jgi:hypothetical protein